MAIKRPHPKADNVEPDLPITPMLDMAFQLLAFFVMTYNPSPPEGHLDMALPKIEGGADSTPPPTSLDEEADELTVVVDAHPEGDLKGQISQIRLREKSDPGEGRALGANSQALFTALQERLKDKKKASKVKLEMADALVYKLVIKLMDEITRAGYKQVAPSLHMPRK